MIDDLKDRFIDDDLLNAPKVNRTHTYIQKPADYEIECLLCGGRNIEWSEFESHIWCYECEKDVFIPQGYAGIFGGPIPWRISKMLGISFDRVSLDGKRILKCDKDEKTDEERINDDRHLKLESILTGEIVDWKMSWVYNEELHKYKIEINKKIYN